jgi:prepilin-type N-terminal cleavage/methylation domain-containing protein
MAQSATHKHKNDRGFSLLELVIVVAILVTLAAITVPRVMNAASDIKLRYFATNYSGLLQTARMQAVRKNAPYWVQPTTLASGETGYYVHFEGNAYVAGDPILPVDSQVTIHPGSGSGAPNESTFTSGTSSTGLSFTVNTASADPPAFNARGLPCIGVVGTYTCPYTSGQGFVVFLSKSSATGNINWAAVAITPSGHMQVWTCDGSGNWIQRD